MKNIAIVFLMLFCAASAKAQFHDGNRLSKWARGYDRSEESNATMTDTMDARVFMGYVTGAIDALPYGQVCPASNVTVGQVAAIVSKFLRENPDKWNLPASALVALALNPVFPCKK